MKCICCCEDCVELENDPQSGYGLFPWSHIPEDWWIESHLTMVEWEGE